MSEGASPWGSGGASDPWKVNYFDPPSPRVPAPSPRARAPRLIPEQHELFTVQRHALDVMHDIEAVRMHLGHHDDKKIAALLNRLERDAENTYRVIRTWLRTNVNREGN